MSDSRRLAGVLLLSSLIAGSGMAIAQKPATAPSGGGIEMVELPSANSPLISIRLQFEAGSIHDPAGKEGLASLTAAMISDAGTQKRSYTDLVEALYPMAASINGNTDREVTLIAGNVHRDKLAEYTALLEEAVLQPGFSQADFDRNKEQLVATLTNGLRSSDEALGLELIQDEIFRGHPYGHSPIGTVEGLKSITLDDVKAFYKQHYTQAGLMLGIAGGYPQDYAARLKQAFGRLPQGQKGAKSVPPAPAVTGRNFTLVEKQTGSVGIHFGFPLPVNRADPDYYPLMVADSFLGEHRTMNGRLMQQLREKRGLNYGDYAYIEYWASPPSTSNPSPNVPRHQQYFSVWIRPVVPVDAQFALRDALYEVQRLWDQGMTKADFELSRDFVINYSKLWAQSLSRRLGFMMDSRYYGMPYYIDEIDKRLKTMTVEQVNAAIKKYLQPDNYQAVFVTANAQKLKETLEKDDPSPKAYNATPEADVVETDKTIQVLKVKPTSIRILPVDQVFQK
ncbi:MAG: pitrilysin family protein [Thermoanaerobaculia bacterium]